MMWNEQSIRNYIGLLESKGLPVIFDLEHLRRLIGVEKQYFYKLTNSINESYSFFTIRKRNGGSRTISIPFSNLRTIQNWILNNILTTQQVAESATGFIKGKSIVDNAKPHIGHKYIYKTDIVDFFSSIKIKSVLALFLRLGYVKEVAYILARFCTYDGYLPQGAPTSPYISNLILYNFDIELQKICCLSKFSYTRYADDITISSNGEHLIDSNLLSATITKLLQDISFELKINFKKTKVLHPGQRKIVTGVLVNEKLNVPKEIISDIRLELFCLNKHGLSNRIKHYNEKHKTALSVALYRQKIYGKICFVNMINPKKAEKLFQEFYKIKWLL